MIPILFYAGSHTARFQVPEASFEVSSFDIISSSSHCSMYPTKDIPTLRCLYEFIVEKLPAGAKVPAHNTFLDWYWFSCRFANLAEGGMVYLLLIIAGLDLR